MLRRLWLQKAKINKLWKKNLETLPQSLWTRAVPEYFEAENMEFEQTLVRNRRTKIIRNILIS